MTNAWFQPPTTAECTCHHKQSTAPQTHICHFIWIFMRQQDLNTLTRHFCCLGVAFLQNSNEESRPERFERHRSYKERRVIMLTLHLIMCVKRVKVHFSMLRTVDSSKYVKSDIMWYEKELFMKLHSLCVINKQIMWENHMWKSQTTCDISGRGK